MKPLRRFTDHGDAGKPYTLSESHIAVRLGTSLFREGRLRAARGARALVSGHNSRKIGAVIMKGRWRGFPVFTLTLEERATCPRTCAHWLDCYGNKMNWPTRWMADADLTPAIDDNLRILADEHIAFVIRLHVLGDFFSVAYVDQWERWLDQFPGLRVYGYTAWPHSTEIGARVLDLAARRWDRFAVRGSNSGGPTRATITIDDPAAAGIRDGAIVCPAQTGKSECCATCALCWQTERNIAFLRH